MSKKFFSLIHGEKIHIAPNTKVISADAFSKVIDAQEVLKQVQEDAEQYKVEITTEIEKVKEQSQKEGFEQGYSEWVEKIAELDDEIKQVRSDMQKMVVPISLKAAKKIVGRELETSDSAVVDIISNSLKAVAQHKKIKIYVNRKDFEIVEANREQIKEVFEKVESLSIQPQDDVDPGGCVIETEGGIINAQIENQWMILENAFQKLISKQDPFGTKKELPKAEEAAPHEKPQKEETPEEKEREEKEPETLEEEEETE